MFQFLPTVVAIESKVVGVATSSAAGLAVLSSRAHVSFSLRAGGFLEDRPAYQHSEAFKPFPFAACLTDDSSPALHDRLAEVGERLDAHRKARLEEHDFLTMTGMYNVLERVRELEKQAPQAVTVWGPETGLTLTDAADASHIATLGPSDDVEIKAEHGRVYLYLPRRVVSVRALGVTPGTGGSTAVSAVADCGALICLARAGSFGAIGPDPSDAARDDRSAAAGVAPRTSRRACGTVETSARGNASLVGALTALCGATVGIGYNLGNIFQ